MLSAAGESPLEMRVDPQSRIDSSPFPVTEGPFLIKGVGVRGTREYFEKVVPGGNAAVLNELRSQEQGLAEFWQQPFIASGQYDIFAFARIGQTAADSAHQPLYQFMKNSGSIQAAHDLQGIYKLILRAFSPLQIMDRICRVARLYFNFGPIEARMLSDRRAEIVRFEVPAPLMTWYASAAAGYTEMAVARTGVKDVNAEFSYWLSGAQIHGVDACTVRFIVSWS